nr:MAG TPA: hypothetical protein [Caudoviricetes sp.]
MSNSAELIHYSIIYALVSNHQIVHQLVHHSPRFSAVFSADSYQKLAIAHRIHSLWFVCFCIYAKAFIHHGAVQRGKALHGSIRSIPAAFNLYDFLFYLVKVNQQMSTPMLRDFSA